MERKALYTRIALVSGGIDWLTELFLRGLTMNQVEKKWRAWVSDVLGVGMLIGAVATAPAAQAATYLGKAVTILQSPTPTQNCLYFQLSGVAQADPVAPNNPWFAVPSTQNGYSQIYATLLAARVAGTTVGVVTSGNFAGGTCGAGFAEILYLNF